MDNECKVLGQKILAKMIMNIFASGYDLKLELKPTFIVMFSAKPPSYFSVGESGFQARFNL